MEREHDVESEHEPTGEIFRPNVAALLVNAWDMLFIGERLGVPGAWQFPQGGADPGEKLVDALYREVREEIGVRRRHLEVIDARGGYRYYFRDRVKRRGFSGQEQTYYLCRFLGSDDDIDVGVKKPEFSDWRWIYPEQFRLEWVPEFKRDVYRRVLADFFDVRLPL